MNIFAIDYDPVLAAKALCNKHCVKMVSESTELLCTALYALGDPVPCDEKYVRRNYINNRFCLWARETHSNFEWLLKHGRALAAEYNFRYGKIHDCQKYLDRIQAPKLPSGDLTPFARSAAVQEFDIADPIEAYRAMYIRDKAYFARWTRRPPPAWFPNGVFIDKKPTMQEQRPRTILRRKNN